MTKIIKKYLPLWLVFLACSFLFLNPLNSKAAAPLTDWLIRDFQTDLTLNSDSSLTIVENITADCGDLPDKHGIFRVLPTEIKTNQQTYKNPVTLIGITKDGQAVPYTAKKDLYAKTLTWQIGDQNQTVSGLNRYQIKYTVNNAVRFENKDFDELYWNILGNFWDMEIEHFSASLYLPDQISQTNSKTWLYSGQTGSTINDLKTELTWPKPNLIKIEINNKIPKNNGLTLSLTFSKNLVIEQIPTFWEKYRQYLWLFLPLLTLIFCFLAWRKYGADQKLHRAITPEFEIPDQISPIKMGFLLTEGAMKPSFFAASIINLAVKGAIKIEQTKKSFLGGQDHLLTLIDLKKKGLDSTERLILAKLFTEKGKETISLNKDIKDKFTTQYSAIGETARKQLIDDGLISAKSLNFRLAFGLLGLIFAIGSFFLFAYSFLLGLSLLSAGLILFFFCLLMPQRTAKGALLLWRIQGFKLYMKTAEKYRQQFFEKENIFETFLPYAIVFGLTKEWTKKVEQLKGAEYFQTYHPIWFVGANLQNFDLNSFNSVINGISSNVGSASGASGGGFSGGGGGGGGGGGW